MNAQQLKNAEWIRGLSRDPLYGSMLCKIVRL